MSNRLFYALLLVALLSLVVLTAPAHAEGWADKLGAAVLMAPNDGNLFGGSLNYQVHEHLWLEGAVRRDSGGTAEGLGASTDAQVIADLVGRLLEVEMPAIPKRARVGATIIGDKFIFIAYDTGI